MLNRLWLLIIAVLISLGLAVGSSWLLVMSQNPASVEEPLTDYGP
jgi:hypothetical protein